MSNKSVMDALEKKDYDYIRIPKDRLLYYSMSRQEYGCPIENEIKFVGEPIFEKLNFNETRLSQSSTDNWKSVTIDNHGIKITPYSSTTIDGNGLKRCELKVDNPIRDYYTNLCEKENKNMNKLLEIYKMKRIEEIDDKYSELRKGILQHDPLIQAAEEYNKKLEENLEDKTLVEEYKLNPERKVTTASKNILNDIEYKHEKEWEQIDDLLKTIQAHLDMADTFEQKQEILINYGIINSNGRLNINKKEETETATKYAVEKQPKKLAKKFRKD